MKRYVWWVVVLGCAFLVTVIFQFQISSLVQRKSPVSEVKTLLSRVHAGMTEQEVVAAVGSPLFINRGSRATIYYYGEQNLGSVEKQSNAAQLTVSFRDGRVDRVAGEPAK